LYFIEFKQRQGKNTRKFRCTTRSEDYGTVTPLVKDFTNDIHKALHNGEPLNTEISPAISTKYQRVTLVNKHNEEKITIDFNIRFGQEREVNHPPKQSSMPNLAIIELKTVEKRTTTHEVFAKHGLEKAHGCSKYCLGHYFLGNVSEWNHFQNTINKAINLSHNREVCERECAHNHENTVAMH